jgi:hypothetical protein
MIWYVHSGSGIFFLVPYLLELFCCVLGFDPTLELRVAENTEGIFIRY